MNMIVTSMIAQKRSRVKSAGWECAISGPLHQSQGSALFPRAASARLTSMTNLSTFPKSF